MTSSKILNGTGKRVLTSWIDTFVTTTENIESPAIFRKWSAISAIGSVLERKVWLMTSSPIFANMYIFLIGHPGTGKSRTINAVKRYLDELPEFKFAPISVTPASLIDSLSAAKRTITRHGHGEPLEYNTLTICAEEMGTFIHSWDKQMTDLLSLLFDNALFSEAKRGNDLKIKIKAPNVSLLTGSTPANLMAFMPETAWGQGFTSRLVMVFSDERIVGDDFAKKETPDTGALLHDIKIINGLIGQFTVSQDYHAAVKAWRENDEDITEFPKPTHPKLIHYNTRRRVTLYKLSMISAIDRGNALVLSKADFNRAMGWLIEAEAFMPDIFKAGATGADGKAMEEVFHQMRMFGDLGMKESALIKIASKLVPIHSVQRMIEIMERSGMIRVKGVDKRTGLRVFEASPDYEI